MKNIFLSIALLISVFLIQVECSAQVRTVNGMVFTFDSIPLAHVDIKVKSSKLEVKSILKVAGDQYIGKNANKNGNGNH